MSYTEMQLTYLEFAAGNPQAWTREIEEYLEMRRYEMADILNERKFKRNKLGLLMKECWDFESAGNLTYVNSEARK